MKIFTSRKKFKRIGPQVAKHTEGYIVGGMDRHHFMYKEDGITVKIEREPVLYGATPLYIKSLKACDNEGKEIILTEDRKKIIIDRIVEGLKCLDIESEIVDNSKSTNLNNLNFSSMRRDTITGAWIKVDTDAK